VCVCISSQTLQVYAYRAGLIGYSVPCFADLYDLLAANELSDVDPVAEAFQVCMRLAGLVRKRSETDHLSSVPGQR